MSKNDHIGHGPEATNAGVIPFTSLTSLKRLTRREVLGYMGAGAAMSLIGVPRAVAAQASASPSCVVKPQQTEGPYFVDEKLNRTDIRNDPTDGTARPGAELRLAFIVTRVDGTDCAPLAGAMVDVWHCDAQGMYSDVSDGPVNTRGKQFLRGYQMTDKDGAARFITIFPGWYQGRTTHLHFKIRTEAAHARGRGREFTSQLYFDDALTDQVMALPPYAARGPRSNTNDRDSIFRRGGSALTLQVTQEGKAYTATFDIGLQAG